MSLNKNLNTDSKFYRKIESNPNICTNCYRRISYELKPHDTMPDCVSPKKEYQNSVFFDYFDDRTDSGRPSVQRSFCKCGFVDSGKIRPLDKKELMKVSVRIRNRLQEENIKFNEDIFFDVVREKKSDPDNQFNEEVILEEAIEKSLITEDE